MTEQISIKAAARELTIVGTVAEYLGWYRDWNADESAIYAIAKDLPHASTVIDVGANIGIVTCSLAVQRPDLTIIAIEPVPDNFACLEKNISDNKLDNVQVIHAAASDKPGELKLSVNGPWSQVLDNGEVTVSTVSLDQFSDRNVSLVKIDVEGWEPHVLAGGRKLFSELRPKVFMEWNTWSLLLAHHDPIAFARAVWKAFDVKELYFCENPQGAPTSDVNIVHENIVRFGSVTDLLMEPRNGVAIPSLEEMIFSPAHREAIKAK